MDRPPRRPCSRTQRSTALTLAPALLLVVIALCAIAIDLSLMHAAKRSAYRTLSAAADDAASMVDSRHLLLSGDIRLDQEAARRVALAHLGLHDADGFSEPAFDFVAEPDISFRVDENTVVITATVTVEHILLSAMPGMSDHTTFEVRTTGRMVT